MNVVGVDPAPTKGLDVFDGRHRHVPLDAARSLINELKEQQNVLVCWDAPLTGPPTAVVAGGNARGSDFSQRPIESFFSRRESGFKVPEGISMRGYSGCPHWALSRSLLGLPQVGPFDVNESSLPLVLVTTDNPPIQGRHVVEVHPAVALWLWTRNERETGASWKYKKSLEVMSNLWDILLAIPRVSEVIGDPLTSGPASDDELDAIVAYMLGFLWVREHRSVVLLGDSNRGTFLLPRVDGLEDAWARYVKRSA
jgi:predicted RNase H-like nuclease